MKLIKMTQKQGQTKYGLFKCPICNKPFETQYHRAKNDNIKSCKDCRGFDSKKDYTSHILYSRWNLMIGRCYNKKNKSYKNYGGRGIEVEFNSIEEYIKYIESLDNYSCMKTENLSIDREDNDGNYKIGNLRLSTSSVQRVNQRLSAKNNSGFVGVSQRKVDGKYEATIWIDGENKRISVSNKAEECAVMRNEYIIKNNLHHKLNVI